MTKWRRTSSRRYKQPRAINCIIIVCKNIEKLFSWLDLLYNGLKLFLYDDFSKNLLSSNYWTWNIKRKRVLTTSINAAIFSIIVIQVQMARKKSYAKFSFVVQRKLRSSNSSVLKKTVSISITISSIYPLVM